MKTFQLFLLLFTQISFAQTTVVTPFLESIVQEFPNVRDIAISPKGDEAYFTAQSYMGNRSAIIVVKKEKERWTSSEVAFFSGQYMDLEPAFSPDGLRLYFVSDRPNSFSEAKPGNMDIWYLERKKVGAKWSQPINLGAPINTEGNEFYPSLAQNGNLYFTSDAPSALGKDDIFVSKLEKGNYQEPTSLSAAINTEGYEFNAFVAPDESYLIFSGYNRKDGLGSGDLYISFQKEGAWTTATNLGASMNSEKMDYCPFVHGQTLFFTSKRDATQTQLDKTQDKAALLKEMNQYENGLSRLYQVSLETVLKEK